MLPASTSVTCSYSFEAAHRLPWHTGKCRNLHGHSYRLEVTVAGQLDGHGVVIDFDELNAIVRASVIDRWDHADLNEHLENPTAELLAHQAWELLSQGGLALARLRLWETTESFVELLAPQDTR